MSEVYAPNWYYEVDDYKENECSNCMANDQRIDIAREALQLLIDRMYSTVAFDEARFESDLDDLCYSLGLDIPKGDLQIMRKDNFMRLFSQNNNAFRRGAITSDGYGGL